MGMMAVLLFVGSVTSFNELPRRISDFLSLKFFHKINAMQFTVLEKD
jgi:hypothetical protein